MDEFTRREIIMDHYQNPKNKKEVKEKTYKQINTNNSSCIDNLDIYVKMNGSVIEDICFSGEACAISTSSTSIMISNLIGKTIEEAKCYIKNFENMVEEKEYQEELLKEAIVYNEIYKQNNRKNCALLPYKGIKKLLEELS